MSETVQSNSDNDMKYRDTIIPDEKKKKKQLEESAESNEDTLEYFTE